MFALPFRSYFVDFKIEIDLFQADFSTTTKAFVDVESK